MLFLSFYVLNILCFNVLWLLYFEMFYEMGRLPGEIFTFCDSLCKEHLT